ncbi:hypothetical protein ScFU149_08430 [Streptococcus canis]|nr:hypothetical protein ScFU6_19600 [Streptococcus canis]GFK30726.1 hypothetical protein ScFU149_08430 [Streptococcus canis]
MINENMNLLANTNNTMLNPLINPLKEFIACAYINGSSTSYSRCVYCHQTIKDGFCKNCQYI